MHGIFRGIVFSCSTLPIKATARESFFSVPPLYVPDKESA